MSQPPPRIAHPAERIVGTRVVLQRHRLDRAQAMFELVDGDRERLGRWLPWVESTETVTDERSYIRHTHERWKDASVFDWSILRRGDEAYCGNVGLHHIVWPHGHCEVGYWLGAAFEGHGYVSEAVALVQDAAFALGLVRVEIRCDPDNRRSCAVPRRLGYTREGRLRSNIWSQGRYRDTIIYAMLAKEHQGVQ